MKTGFSVYRGRGGKFGRIARLIVLGGTVRSHSPLQKTKL